MENYQTRNGQIIDIPKLKNEQLFKLYRYYLAFHLQLTKIARDEEIQKDVKFMDYVVRIGQIKLAMRSELKKRGLKVSALSGLLAK